MIVHSKAFQNVFELWTTLTLRVTQINHATTTLTSLSLGLVVALKTLATKLSRDSYPSGIYNKCTYKVTSGLPQSKL